MDIIQASFCQFYNKTWTSFHRPTLLDVDSIIQALIQTSRTPRRNCAIFRRQAIWLYHKPWLVNEMSVIAAQNVYLALPHTLLPRYVRSRTLETYPHSADTNAIDSAGIHVHVVYIIMAATSIRHLWMVKVYSKIWLNLSIWYTNILKHSHSNKSGPQTFKKKITEELQVQAHVTYLPLLQAFKRLVLIRHSQ